jgi:hypothetical protein
MYSTLQHFLIRKVSHNFQIYDNCIILYIFRAAALDISFILLPTTARITVQWLEII